MIANLRKRTWKIIAISIPVDGIAVPNIGWVTAFPKIDVVVDVLPEPNENIGGAAADVVDEAVFCCCPCAI